MTPRSSRRRKLEALYPALAAGLIILLYMSVFKFLVNDCSNVNSGLCAKLEIEKFLTDNKRCATAEGVVLSDIEKAKLWPGRLQWLFFFALNNIVNAVLVVSGLYLVWRAAAGRNTFGRFGRRLPGLGACVGVLLIILVVLSAWRASTDAMRAFMPQLTELLGCTAKADLAVVDKLTHVTNLLSILATTCVLAATCAVLWPPRGGRRLRTSDVALRARLLRFLLYAGAASLVAYVLRVSFTMNWALMHVSPLPAGGREGDVVAKIMESFSSAFVTGQGGAATLLLAAIYLPAVLVLRTQADTAGRRLPPQVCQEWLKSIGLSASFSEHLPRIATVLGPLLAGPLGELLGRLSK